MNKTKPVRTHFKHWMVVAWEKASARLSSSQVTLEAILQRRKKKDPGGSISFSHFQAGMKTYGESVAKRVKKRREKERKSHLREVSFGRVRTTEQRNSAPVWPKLLCVRNLIKIGNQHVVFFLLSFLIYLQKRERNPLKLCQGRTLLDDARHGCKLMTLNCAVQQAEGGGLDEWGGGGGVDNQQKHHCILYIVYISKQNRPLSRLHLDKTSRHGVRISPEEFT